jgi:two-component system cell cycle sensor histidine kinase/response regulator CckA
MAVLMDREIRRPVGRFLTRPLRIAAIGGGLVLLGTLLGFMLLELRLAPVEAVQLWLEILAGLAISLAALVITAGLSLALFARRDALSTEVLQAVQAAHFVTDADGETRYINRAAAELFADGRPPLETLRAGLGEDDESRQLFERLEASARVGRTGRARLLVRLGAELLWFDIVVTPLRAKPGQALWRVEDITSAEELRHVVEAERSRLFDFFDEAPTGFYALDETGRFAMINRVFAEWLGSAPETLIKEHARLQDFMLPDQPKTRTVFDPLAPAEGLEVILQGRHGRILNAAVSQTVLREGAHLHTNSVIRDLAPERAWEEALRPSRERFQRFFEIAPVGIALIDTEARFKETNRALDALLTDGRGRLLGRGLLDFIADDAHHEVQGRLAAISAGVLSARPLETRLKAPHEKTVALFVSRLETADGALAGLILHFIDLTEQKNLEVQFAQSQKMQAVGQLAGGVAHDFNNLLTAMIGFCDLLLMRFRPGDQSFADIMQIKQNANRAANLVRQLLAFSRQQTLQPRVIRIGEVLSELSHLLNRLLGENVELKMIHGRDLGPVRVDQGQLEQVIINLAVNARDAMTNGGTLTIRTLNVESKEPIQHALEIMPSGAYILIEVTDDGVGIPREIIGRIFEPFFSTKEIGSGTGLGLSTVYGIVKQTGGFIFVESAVGSGTKFSIYLPRHDEVEAGVTVRPVGELGEPLGPLDLTGTGTVLLVEDEDPVRMFSARALRNKGYTVLEAKSGEAAIKIIEEGVETIDLIITDVVMPRMDGPTMIKLVREKLPDMKVIFISGYTEDTFRKRLDNEHGIHFLPKPFSLKQLATKTKEIMTGPVPGD